MKEQKSPKKPLVYYYVIVVVVLLLLNALVFPSLFGTRVTEVTYDAFLSQLDDGKITQVEDQEDKIAFIGQDEKGKEAVFVTGKMEDGDTLSKRLQEAGVQYGKEIPKEESPLLTFILSWVFPILMFVILGQLLTRYMQKKLGGPNAMTFGKSNAKIYVEAKTGKTFTDVAGQDEAKEALSEIVDFLHNPSKYADIGAALPKGALLVGPFHGRDRKLRRNQAHFVYNRSRPQLRHSEISKYSKYDLFQFCPSAWQIRPVKSNHDLVIALYSLLTEKCSSIGGKIGVRLLCVSLIPLDVDGITVVAGRAVKHKG